MPQQCAVNRRVYLDEQTDEWCAEFDDAPHTVVRSTSKQLLEEFLDYVDAGKCSTPNEYCEKHPPR
jgi:hypothetical protein